MVYADVLIVTHTAGALLDDCLAAVRNQTCAPVRIVVVVSSDAPVSKAPDIEILRTAGPTDFAPAANLGLATMGARPVVLLNDDTVATPTFIAELLAAMDGPGIYQPHIKLENGRVDNTGHLLFWDGFNVARDRGEDRPECGTPCGAFSGAAVMFSPEILNTVGVFDEEFCAYGEDLDLSLRAVRQGFPIRFVERATITHKLGATYGRVSKRKIFLVERNRTSAAIRSMPLRAVATMPLSSALRLSVMGIAALTGRGLARGAGLSGATAAVLGMVAGVKSAPKAWAKRCEDRPKWTMDGQAMWDHIQRSRVPLNKLAGAAIIAPFGPPATDQQSQRVD